ncbi:hypothetical protein NP233_g12908 [Leucocoprinus birnbaumii]|uniref:Protein kinase domain-containing protein n=1 Tax=Leucocoprinus birnbaumii TaxID=56174 RepID=A0AAD5VDW2_9AGAR|nr:hypothetical protein NP233_g12908 [Leucocoprinus birnbaumii]
MSVEFFAHSSFTPLNNGFIPQALCELSAVKGHAEIRESHLDIRTNDLRSEPGPDLLSVHPINHQSLIDLNGMIPTVAVKVVRRRHPGDSERNHKVKRLVMPIHKNGDLIGFVRQRPEADKPSLVRGVVAGLEYMHSFPQNPVVRGDMKASNVLVTDTDEACIADFGLAKILCTPGYTTPNFCGSSRWMPPEILRGDELPTTYSDIWALGMTILEARISSHYRVQMFGSLIRGIGVYRTTPIQPCS